MRQTLTPTTLTSRTNVLTDRAAIRRLVDAWLNSPELFAVQALGITTWARQTEILRAVAEYHRVAVRSGHKVGKSTSAVILAVWWLLTRPNARVIMTSASARQIRSILWRELKRIHRDCANPRRLGIPLGGKLNQLPDLGYQLEDGREIVGFSTNEPERMAGISGPNVLFILDEASGIPEEIFEAIEGNRAGGARIVMFSNPTQTSGTFFDAFNSPSSGWHCIRISSEESPNVVEGRDVIPGLATRGWIDEKSREWGKGSSLYDVRVDGNFPSQGDNAVTPLHLIESAKVRWNDTKAEGRIHVGVDPARFGDDETVAIVRRGNKAYRPNVIPIGDSLETAELIRQLCKKVRKPGDQKPRVMIDVIGIGAGVFDQLRKWPDELEAIAVNSSHKSDADDQYSNLRSQLCFGVTQWLKEGGALEGDDMLDQELLAPQFSFDARNRMKVEPKDEIKKRLNPSRSPDRADALALACYTGGAIEPIRLPSRGIVNSYRFGNDRGFG